MGALINRIQSSSQINELRGVDLAQAREVITFSI